jgi:hypothetical protein
VFALALRSSRIDFVNRRAGPSTSSVPRSPSPEGRWRSRALLALGLLAIGGHGLAKESEAAEEEPAAHEPIAAVWKKEEVLFTYQSTIAIYNCDALENRVASLLYAVGARQDMDIKVTGCSHSAVPIDTPSIDRPVVPGGAPPIGRTSRTWAPGAGSSYLQPARREQISTVHVRLSMPVEMTPDVVAELEADKSRRELISRVTGNPIPRFDDPIPFAAERRVVTLSYKTVRIEPAECELLDQLVTSSFRNLGLRVVRQGYSCNRNRVSNIYPSLDVEALVPAQFEPEEIPQVPIERDGENEDGAPAPTDAAPPDPATDPPPE